MSFKFFLIFNKSELLPTCNSNNVFLSPHSLGADHELPLELDKPAVGLERGEGVGQGGVFFFIFLSFQKKVRAWAEKKGATDFAAVGELAKMI